MKKSQVTKRFAAVLACFTLLFASCGKKAPETPVAAVSLDKSSLTLVLGGAFKLTAEKENTDDDIVWACSNDKVATVGNGTVTAVGVGSAVVSASAGGASAQCAVSVTTGEQVPLIKLDYDFLEIIIGNPITVSAAVFIDGFPDNNFDGFNWSSGNAEFFTVTPISGDKSKASVAAVDLGMSYLSVAADYFGREISAEIDVTVKEDISFNIKNIAPTALGYHVTLSTAAPDNEFTPDIEVWENGEIAAGAALDWSLKAGESDTVLDSTALAAGVFTAAAVGSTIAVFSCESRLSGEIFSGEISVTVSKPVIPLSQAFDFELNANRPATILTGAAGAVQSVELDGTAIVAYTANTNESVPALKFAFTAGAGTFGLGGVTGLEYGEHDL
ncbi:MAG: Ig-like domain-containing protein, partial [Clostridiales bacterium]|nr:Ig-like domain-containing protein [Clostridiales bacterium]